MFDRFGEEYILSEVWFPGQDGFLIRGRAPDVYHDHPHTRIKATMSPAGKSTTSNKLLLVRSEPLHATTRPTGSGRGFRAGRVSILCRKSQDAVRPHPSAGAPTRSPGSCPGNPRILTNGSPSRDTATRRGARRCDSR